MIERCLAIFIIVTLSCPENLAQSADDEIELLRSAEQALSVGESEDARELFQSALRYPGIGAVHQAKAYGGLGLSYAALGDLFEAKDALNESIRLARLSSSEEIVAKSQFNLGLVTLSGLGREAAPTDWFELTRGGSSTRDVYWKNEAVSAGDVEQAIQQLLTAGESAHAHGDSSLAIRAWATAAKYRVDTSREEALSLLMKAFDALPTTVVRRDEIEAALLLGETAVSIMPPLEDEVTSKAKRIAFESLNRSLLASRMIDDERLESYSLGLLGRVYGLDGRVSEAKTLTEQAVILAEQSDAREVLFVWNGQLAGYFERQKNVEAALSAYERAAENIQSVRPDLAKSVAGAGQVSSRELIEPILLSYADLLLTAGNPDQIREARNVVEQLKTIEFERFFEETCVANSAGKKTDLASVGDGTVVLYPVIFNDRIELLISFGDKIKRVEVKVSREALEFRTRSARNGLRQNDNVAAPLDDLSQLHAWLIAPMKAELAKVPDFTLKTIVFAPDGVLRGLPISALYNADSKRFLIEDHAVAYTIGLSLFDPQPFEDVTRLGVHAGIGEALAVPSNINDEDDISFSELNAVATELNQVEALIPGPVLLNSEFTKEAFGRALSENRYTVAHLATHATFGRTASESYLLAHSGTPGTGARITLDELEAYTSQARIRGEPIELLTLSACETGVGDPDAENENAMLGLAGVAYKAGARSVLASLWQVNDDSTGVLMARFYSNLVKPDTNANGQPTSKAEALRQAQISLLRDPTGKTKHPSHWAAFILFGNWL